jgi:predicted DNA-binding transcriptional regulator AlpA
MKTEVQNNLAYSIDQFCNIHSISRAEFYLLLKKGLAPTTMRVGRRRLVSIESAKEWRQRMENSPNITTVIEEEKVNVQRQ